MTHQAADPESAEHQTVPERVLVLDGDMTPALAIARSLGRLGLDVVIGSHEEKPIAGYSRYVTRTVTYPNPLENEAQFLQWCKPIVTSGDYRLIVPVTERTVVPMQALLDLPNAHSIAIAPREALAVALDKDETTLLAQRLGISVPKSNAIEDIAQLDACRDFLQMPVVIKPSRSIGASDGGRKQLSVEYAFSKQELERKLKDLLRYGPVLLQDFVPGQGVGIELIADHGEICFAFQHLRLHEVPLTGGGSSFRMSVEPEPELLEASRQLIRALNWHGVAMVELKWDPATRNFTLMEINGRFWGSLPLAVAAGADFPLMLYELMSTGSINPRKPAQTGVYCRKLSSDIDWLELVVRQVGPAEIVDFPKGAQIARDALRIFSPRHHFDVQQWRDPLPGLVDISRILRYQLLRIWRMLGERRELSVQKRAWRDGSIGERGTTARKILFLCYGNINRSALAECYFKQHLHSGEVEITSAGFHEQEGRPADPTMVEIAGEADIDLQNWASRKLTGELVTSSDLILAMELDHIHRLAREYPEAQQKAFLLGMAAAKNPSNGEIADPYGKTPAEYSVCLDKIIKNLAILADFIANTKRSKHQ